jgi:hypothetical protein
VSKAKD